MTTEPVPHRRWRRHLLTITVVAVAVVSSEPVTAQEDSSGGGGGGPVIDLSGVIDAITDLPGEIADASKTVLKELLYDPFTAFMQAVADLVVTWIVWLPDPRTPAVYDIHADVFAVSLLLTGVTFTAIGFMYMGYEPFGIPFERVQPLIPRLLLAIGFGSVAPWALSYPVRISEALAQGLAVEEMALSGMLMLTIEIVLVAAVQAILLVGLIAILVVQKVFVLFGVAAAPLIAVLWALPFQYTRNIANQLIGAWWGFVLLPPFMVIALRLTVALLSLDGFTGPEWIAGIGGILLLLGLPYLVVSSAMTAVTPATAAGSAAAGTVKTKVRKQYRRSTETPQHNTPYRRENRFNRE